MATTPTHLPLEGPTAPVEAARGRACSLRSHMRKDSLHSADLNALDLSAYEEELKRLDYDRGVSLGSDDATTIEVDYLRDL